ncbi:MAG TPA: DUF222 domain-containing protein [Gemmatimonadota bacterium]|nr:DUF222 domain-containing protein [Gemmatimonadota bacterium]
MGATLRARVRTVGRAVRGAGRLVREVGSAAYEAVTPDALRQLGDDICALAAHIHAATCRFLLMVARFDRLKGWEAEGQPSCAHWLHFRTGLSLSTAREHVRVARALEGLPETAASMAQGRLSYSKVRALTRVATAETESDLLDLAEGSTTAQIERMVRGWKKASRRSEAAGERLRHEARRLAIYPDDDGMYVVRGLLEAETGALLMRAVEAAGDALYRAERDALDPVTGEPSGRAPRTPRERRKEAARRRADAIGLLAERAMGAGFAGAVPEREESADEAEDGGPAGGEAESPADAPSPAPVSGCRAERYQVILHVDADTLTRDREPGRSELEDGTRVSAETSRRLSCDAALVRVTHAPADRAGAPALDGRPPHGSILDVGRRTRTIPSALRRALEIRDRGCRFPGCGLRFTDAHHVTHWGDGGETSLQNCVLLCRYHHRLVHEGGWTLEWWGPGRAVFLDPKGEVHVDPAREEASWRREREERGGAGGAGAGGEGARSEPATSGARPADPADLAADLVADNLSRGVEPGPMTASARWKRERDIPDEVFFRATEAGIEGGGA